MEERELVVLWIYLIVIFTRLEPFAANMESRIEVFYSALVLTALIY